MENDTDKAFAYDLVRQGREIDADEAEADRLEAEARAVREKAAHRRSEWNIIVSGYLRFAERAGKPIPEELRTSAASHEGEQAPGPKFPQGVTAPAKGGGGSKVELPENIIVRAGRQRGAVLKFLAKATTERHGATHHQIQRETGLSSERVTNVVYEDVKRGLITRKGDRIMLTEIGLEFVRRLREETEGLPLNAKAPEAS